MYLVQSLSQIWNDVVYVLVVVVMMAVVVGVVVVIVRTIHRWSSHRR